LLKSRITIAFTETGGSLHDKLGDIAPTALSEALTQLKGGSAPRIPQQHAEATYAPKLEREHGLIDWSESTAIIERKIRAYHPWPGAYLVLKEATGRERKLKIFSAVPMEGMRSGQAELAASPSSLVVGTGDGALELREVQLEGKKRMDAADLLRGNPWLRTASVVSTPPPAA
jgi:methionyl-tRNA formyltransferase